MGLSGKEHLRQRNVCRGPKERSPGMAKEQQAPRMAVSDGEDGEDGANEARR